MLLVKNRSKPFQWFQVLPLLMGCLLIFTACSSKDKSADTAEGAYAIAQEYDKDELWERAIQKYQEVKNKFPYSKYATMAELAIADCHYKDESFGEAQVSYQSFKDLHPKHAQIDYVTHRLGLSFFNQLPPTIDRDLTLATSAILYFEEVVKQYPNSAHAKEAAEKRDSAYKMLGEKEQYIADFYFKREKYDSALTRYEGLLKKYPRLGFDARSLSRAAIAAARNGDQDKAKKYLAEVRTQFPGSQEAIEAGKEVRE
jgi:outer membrane protein assembly factor BamD